MKEEVGEYSGTDCMRQSFRETSGTWKCGNVYNTRSAPTAGGCPAAAAAGRGFPAALLRALPASAASACHTPGGSLNVSEKKVLKAQLIGLSQAVTRSLFFAFLHLVLCSRTLGFLNAHSAVKQTHATS
jgi:hypothetical protein